MGGALSSSGHTPTLFFPRQNSTSLYFYRAELCRPYRNLAPGTYYNIMTFENLPHFALPTARSMHGEVDPLRQTHMPKDESIGRLIYTSAI